MPFHPSSNPADWQTRVYNRGEAHRDSAVRSAVLLWPFLLAFLPVGFLLVRILQVEWMIKRAANPVVWLVTLPVFFLMVCLFHGLVKGVSLWIPIQFLREFYRPPEDVNLRRIIEHRLYGVLEMPSPLSRLYQFPSLLVKKGQLVEENGGWQAWMAQHLGGPLRLIVFDGNAVYVERGGRFSRVVGPGRNMAFLDWFETVKEVVDIRPQVREETLAPCWTKDGIKVSVTVRVECCLGNPARGKTDLLYPFDPEAVKAAVERTSVRMPDGKTLTEMKGVDLVWGQVTSVVPDYLGSLNLDEILINHGEGVILSEQTRQELLQRLNDLTRPFGYYVTDIQITRLEPPAVVREQRERNWQADLQSRANLLRAQAEATRIRAVEQARAEAQRDLILAIAEGLNRDPTRRFAEPLLVALTSTITTSLANPLVPPLLTPETLRSLEQLKSLLEGQYGK